jgi:hypothetical protein
MFIFRIEANIEDMELLLSKINQAGEYMNNLYNQLTNDR